MHDYVEYKDRGGHTLIFSGNDDGDSVKTNTFNSPIIAQWIKILPTRWRDRISMQVELYGCSYEHESLSFGGDSFVKKKLLYPIISEYFTIQFRFRTNYGDGVIIHSQGKQGDFFSLQLMNNHLVLIISLGGDSTGSSISAGSLLDDDRWHDVTIILQRKDVTFYVDRVAVSSKVRSDFFTLNLEREVFLGGVPHFNQDGIAVTSNFIGCIENLSFIEINFISELKAGKEEYETFGKVDFTCEHEQVTVITFTSLTSHLQLSGPRQHIMNCSFDFRTFGDGLLFHHKFFEQGYIKLLLEDGKMKIDLLSKHTPKIVAEISDRYLNDGQWHRTALILENNRIEVNIDGISSVTIRQFSMITSEEYVFGGGPYPLRSFIGCMRNIHIDGHYINLSSLSKDQYYEVILDTCQLTDRCVPNPCEHGGICTQNQEEFKCHCEKTGYSGAVCHTSRNVVSCEAYRSINPSSGNVDIEIDIDGSGPLDPFPVTCIFPSEGPAMTVLHHDSEKPSNVEGFSEPGSFIRNIIYDADMYQLIQLMNHSHKCKQRLRYDCYNARLLNSSAKESSMFSPFSWWVSRSNQPMDYWGGSLPGSQKCACGLYGNCRDAEKSCNCDSEDDLWLFDEGDLTQMEYLPVRKLRFGDTGYGVREKKGRFTVGPLICEGNTLFDHVITQHSEDATLEFSSFDMDYSGDIYFQFKSTASNFVLFSYKGPSEFIQFMVYGGEEIHVHFGSSGGSARTSTMTSYKLNDDNWHSLYVERNAKELCLIIDAKHMLQITVRHVVQAVSHTPKLIIGASAEYRDGFVGCIRALMLNGISVNLQQLSHDSHYGIDTGCVTKCQSNPCLNNGSCIERYSHYECDCQLTAFKGPVCADGTP